ERSRTRRVTIGSSREADQLTVQEKIHVTKAVTRSGEVVPDHVGDWCDDLTKRTRRCSGKKAQLVGIFIYSDPIPLCWTGHGVIRLPYDIQTAIGPPAVPVEPTL